MSNALLNHVGFGAESVYGTAVAPAVFAPVQESDGMTVEMDKQAVEAIKGTAPKNKSMFVGKVNVAGAYESDLYPAYIGHLFRSGFGGLTSAQVGGETLVYKHTFVESLTKPSLTVEEKFGEVIKRYTGFVVNKLEISGKVGEAIKVAYEGVGKNQADNAGGTATYETARPFNFADMTIVTIGSVSVLAMCEEFSIEYTNSVENRYAVGDNYPKGVFAGQSEVQGKMTLYLDSTTKDLVADYIANTERSIEVKMVSTAIGTASNYSTRIYLPKTQITAIDKKLSTEYNVMELEFEGIEDATDGLIKVELTNLNTSYAA